MNKIVEGKNICFEPKPVSVKEVMETLKKLKPKKSCCSSGVQKRVIQAANEVLMAPLQQIVNTRVRDKKYPDVFRDMVDMPALKRGSKQDSSCYRLVQNSEAVSGILELLVNSQVVKFLQGNSPFAEQKFAFPEKGTAQWFIATYAHWIQNINDSKFSIVTSYDL